ncbi:condensation domain-containing protein [Bacillus licheniformis]|nr:condensation domain-containing protein [Bacillus licheniformis]
MLTALGLALKEWTGQEDFIICLEGHGREDIMEGLNISRTVGWFTSQFPALIQLRHSEDIGYQIKQIKEELRHIPNKGIGYGIYRYLTEEGKRRSRSSMISALTIWASLQRWRIRVCSRDQLCRPAIRSARKRKTECARHRRLYRNGI